MSKYLSCYSKIIVKVRDESVLLLFACLLHSQIMIFKRMIGFKKRIMRFKKRIIGYKIENRRIE